MFLYDQYFRKFAVLKESRLLDPRLNKIVDLTLPKDSILHHMPDNDVEYGIDPTDYILHELERVVMVDHVIELTAVDGNPRRTTAIPQSLTRDYHRRYLRFRPLHRLSSVIRDPSTLVVANYSLLPHLYRYVPSVYANYYRWSNVFNTMWRRVEYYSAECARHQFMVFNIPETLPTVVALRKHSGRLLRDTAEIFSTHELRVVLEFWKWLGGFTEQGVGAVTPEALGRINVIWKYKDHWSLLNLHDLFSWGKNAATEGFAEAMLRDTELEEYAAKLGVSIEDIGDGDFSLQKKFLRYLFVIHNSAVVTPAASPEVTLVDGTVVSAPANTDVVVNGATSITASDLVTVAPPVPEFAEKVVDAGNTPAAAAAIAIDQLADAGNLTAAEYKRLLALSNKYSTIPNPFGEGTLEDLATLKPEDYIVKPLKLPKVVGVFDDSMCGSTLEALDRDYCQNNLQKDIAACVVGLQAGGVLITNYTAERVIDAMSDYYEYTVQFTPVRGKVSTIRFRLPVIGPDGTFISNGVRRRMRRQRTDKPIRKTGPSKVALTSYRSKLFVTRSEAKVANYNNWISNEVVKRGLNDEDVSVTEIRLSNVFNQLNKVPRIYSALSNRCISFKHDDYEFYFDYASRAKVYGDTAVAAAEQKQMVVIGKRGESLLVADFNNVIYSVNGEELVELGTMENILNIGTSNVPVEYAALGVYSKTIPIGIILGYRFGLDNLLRVLKVRSRRVPAGGRLMLTDDEYAIRFSDESLVLSRYDRIAQLVIAGFSSTGYDKIVQKYSSQSFNRPDVYYNVLNLAGVGGRYVKEIDKLFELFIDPITAGELVKMGEPTTFDGLLLRSCELLLTDWAPAENDITYQRLRGYERMAGMVYSELARAISAQGGRDGAAVEISPHQIWNNVVGDPSVKPIEESNPIHCLKEQEVITFGGSGGRSDRSMVKKSRMMDRGDIGVVSEATVDSGQVGIISYTSANPNIVDQRGNVTPINWDTDGPANVLSTSAMISPAAMHDEPRRVNFINIQQSAGIAAVGYHPMPLRTGYEKMVPHRTSDMFAHAAKEDGIVINKTDTSITIEYESIGRVSVDLGRRFGIAAGLSLPHFITTDFKTGDKIKAGDVVAWNTNFFARDRYDPKQVLFKNSTLVTCAIAESNDTLLDSDSISEEVAELMRAPITKVRVRTVNFDQAVRNLVSVGDQVGLDSILCSIEDPVTAANQLFDDESAGLLRQYSGMSLKSKVEGVVEKIEVFYHGDKEDMSETLRDLADTNDRVLMRTAKAKGVRLITGAVDGSMRVEGVPVAVGTLVLKFYITSLEAAGVGDKFVFGNQLKSVCARVMSGVNTTANGTPIGAVFGYESIADRIVASPELMGTTNTLLKVLSKAVARTYRGK